MYTADIVARYIIDYSYDKNKPMSNLRLQKTLYFVQAEFLVTKGQPCFSDEIYAWELGPVVPSVYHEYKVYGSSPIPSHGTSGEYYGISNHDAFLINEMVDQCNKYSTSSLVQFTHEQKPWKTAYHSADRLIAKDAISSFFSEGAKNGN